MNRNFKQIIFYNDASTENTPGVTVSTLVSGLAFKDYLPISQLGVQSIPGTKLYLNGNSNPIMVGFTGVLSIDLTAGGAISEIKFDSASARNINNNASAVLIVDMGCLGGT